MARPEPLSPRPSWHRTVELAASPAHAHGQADYYHYAAGSREQYPSHPYAEGTLEWLAYNRGWNTSRFDVA